MKLLLLGATGLVGRNVLQLALQDQRVRQIIAPTRHRLAPHSKLVNPVAQELGTLVEEVAVHSADSMISAVGTTISKAGSKQAFYQVDYVLPMTFAKAAFQSGALACAFVSSPGASLSIPLFYCRTKGELERDMRSIGFRSLTIVRPGMIGGHREEVRLAERSVFPMAAFLRPVLPRGLWINPASNIAGALLDAVVAREDRLRVLTSSDLV